MITLTFVTKILTTLTLNGLFRVRDEQLDMYQVQEKLSPYMTIETYDGGHHRLAYPSRLNDLITKIHKNILLEFTYDT